ncbi:MAG: hypothetical protein ACQEP1_04690 [Nanobdellota archaeon]
MKTKDKLKIGGIAKFVRNGDSWINSGGNVGIGTTGSEAKLDVQGDITRTGTVSFVEDYNETSEIVYYSSESGKVVVEWTNNTYVNDETYVEFPKHFVYVLSEKEDYHVTVSPVGSLADVGFFEKNETGFIIKSSEKTEVDFHVRGIRKDYENEKIFKENDK